jgi:hypothetical protein
MSVLSKKIEGCHEDYIGAMAAKMKREKDLEWGPRRDLFIPRTGPKTRRDFLALRAKEHAEKVRWSGNFPDRIKI